MKKERERQKKVVRTSVRGVCAVFAAARATTVQKLNTEFTCDTGGDRPHADGKPRFRLVFVPSVSLGLRSCLLPFFFFFVFTIFFMFSIPIRFLLATLGFTSGFRALTAHRTRVVDARAFPRGFGSLAPTF